MGLRTLRRAGRGEAIALGRRLQAVNPLVSEYKLTQAKLLGQAGRWSEAADARRAALLLDPLNLTVRHILVGAAFEMDDRSAVPKPKHSSGSTSKKRSAVTS
jgi:hypothetical protein